MKYRGTIIAIIFVAGIFLVMLSQKDKSPHVKKAVVGLEVPEFTLVDRDGAEYRLSQFKGKTVFVHFWAAWCKECREEMPGIQALYNNRKSDPDFVFISVIWREDPSKSSKYLKDNNYDIPIFIDPDEKAASTFGVTGVPETFIIGPDGVLKRRIIGPGNWDEI